MKGSEWYSWWGKQNIVLPQKNPVLIFEGCDGTGKTTIQEVLRNIIRHAFLIHTSAPKKGNPKEYYYNILNRLLKVVEVLNQPVFFDRFHIGEIVYGSIFRTETMDSLMEKTIFQLEDVLQNKDARIIYVTASPQIIAKRLHDRGDWYVKESDIERILNRYEEVLKKSKLPIYRLDTTNNYTAEDIKNLVLFAYGINDKRFF